MNNEITEGVKEFILAGDSSFTILQDKYKDKDQVVIKYRVKKNDEGTCWFVYTEVVDDGNTTDDGKKLKYQGYLKKDMTFHIGKKGMQNYNKKAIDGLIWVLNHKGALPYIVHVFHHGRCSRCGRRLTDVESLRCGLGPTCRKKSGL